MQARGMRKEPSTIKWRNGLVGAAVETGGGETGNGLLIGGRNYCGVTSARFRPVGSIL